MLSKQFRAGLLQVRRWVGPIPSYRESARCLSLETPHPSGKDQIHRAGFHRNDGMHSVPEEKLDAHQAEAEKLAKLIREGDVKGLMESGSVTERQVAETVIHGRSMQKPYFHPRTHNIPVALIHFRSYWPHLLDLFLHFATHAASSLAIPISQPAYLPTQRSLWTVLRGPFVHKKSQENFERKTHKRAIKVWDADQEVVDRWITYLQLYPLPGVGMRIIRWHRAPVGIGKQHKADESLELGNFTDRKRVEEVAAQIVEQEMAAAAATNSTEVLTSRKRRPGSSYKGS